MVIVAVFYPRGNWIESHVFTGHAAGSPEFVENLANLPLTLNLK